MALKIEDIRDTSPQSLNKLNSTIRAIVSKITGGLDFIDLSEGVQEQLYTYPLQITGEGNLDANYPLEVRFYVPADVKKIKSAKLNAIVTNYRMDSSVAQSGNQTIGVSGTVDISSGGNVSTVTSGASSQTTAKVERWGSTSDEYWMTPPALPNTSIPSYFTDPDNSTWSYMESHGYAPVFAWRYYDNKIQEAIITVLPYVDSRYGQFGAVDLYLLQHEHNMNHYHNIDIDTRHTHNVSLSATVSAHTHPLNEGIKVSSTSPNNVRLQINGTNIGNVMSGSNATQNDIDISEHIKVGQWNVIKVTSSTVARITLYGIIELNTRVYKHR